MKCFPNKIMYRYIYIIYCVQILSVFESSIEKRMAKNKKGRRFMMNYINDERELKDKTILKLMKLNFGF